MKHKNFWKMLQTHIMINMHVHLIGNISQLTFISERLIEKRYSEYSENVLRHQLKSWYTMIIRCWVQVSSIYGLRRLNTHKTLGLSHNIPY